MWRKQVVSVGCRPGWTLQSQCQSVQTLDTVRLCSRLNDTSDCSISLKGLPHWFTIQASCRRKPSLTTWAGVVSMQNWLITLLYVCVSNFFFPSRTHLTSDTINLKSRDSTAALRCTFDCDTKHIMLIINSVLFEHFKHRHLPCTYMFDKSRKDDTDLGRWLCHNLLSLLKQLNTLCWICEMTPQSAVSRLVAELDLASRYP